MKFEGGNESLGKKLQEDPVSVSSNVNNSRENLGTNVTENMMSADEQPDRSALDSITAADRGNTFEETKTYGDHDQIYTI